MALTVWDAVERRGGFVVSSIVFSAEQQYRVSKMFSKENEVVENGAYELESDVLVLTGTGSNSEGKRFTASPCAAPPTARRSPALRARRDTRTCRARQPRVGSRLSRGRAWGSVSSRVSSVAPGAPRFAAGP